MRLAKRLNEELAQQSQNSRNHSRALSPDPEPRSRSYDHKSPPNKGKGIKLDDNKAYRNNYGVSALRSCLTSNYNCKDVTVLLFGC